MRVATVRASVGRVALVATVLFSCLPTSDLSSYSNGALSSQADGIPSEAEPPEGVLPDGMADLVSPESASPDALTAAEEGAEPVEAAPASDCGAECPMPALLGSDGGNAGLGSEVENDGVPNESEADPAQQAGAASCVSGAVLGPDARCFSLVDTPSTWQVARTNCRNQGPGWELATIRSAARNAWLTTLLGTLTDAWVGGSDTELEGVWRWLGDDTAFWNGPATGSRVGDAFVSWNGGTNPEPNGGEASDCLRLRAGGVWADLQCATLFASICEGPSL